MWRLLSIRPLHLGDTPEYIMEEVCRLGTLMFLAPVWRHMGANPVWTVSLSRNLLNVLRNYQVEWNDLKPLLVWSLYSAAVETRDGLERSQFAFMLAMLMNGMGIREWGELRQIVKDVLWIEKVFADSDTIIKDEVMAFLTGIPDYNSMVEVQDA
jgi:hypothetical protein